VAPLVLLIGAAGFGAACLCTAGLGASGLGVVGLAAAGFGAAGLRTAGLGAAGLGAAGHRTAGFGAAGFYAAGFGAPGRGASDLGAVGLAAAGDGAPAPFSAEARAHILEHSPLGPPPDDPSNSVADREDAARLGQRLFFDERLSSGQVSCSTCHSPQHGFGDSRPVSEGAGRGRRHTLSLWNVAYNRWFFWDGRRDSLWSQALTPIESDTEMRGTRLQAVHLVAEDSALRSAYESIFGPLPPVSESSRFPPKGRPVPENPDDPRHAAWAGMRAEDRESVDLAFSRIGKAIEAYERRLVSQRSPFDAFVSGLRAGRESAALSAAARRGLELFVGRGNCRICHSGPNFTDGEFHNTGVPPRDRSAGPDSGRYGGVEALLANPFNLLGRFSDDTGGAGAQKLRATRKTPESWGQFKTPSLRNVAGRGPYMHQGQLATLRDVLDFYSTRAGALPGGPAQEQVLTPLNLSSGEIDDLIAFLESLTDEAIDRSWLSPPSRPSPSARAR